MRFIVLLALALTACDDPAPPRGSTLASARSLGPGVPISIDGTRVATAAPAVPTPLRELVTHDPDTWASVRVEASGDRHFEIPSPATKYPEAQFELAAGANGKLTVSLRRPLDPMLSDDAAAAERRPIATLDDVVAIRITSIERAKALAPEPVEVAVEVDGERHTLADLKTLDTITVLDGKDEGYPLSSILSRFVKIGDIRKVTVHGLGDEKHAIDGAGLRDEQQVFVVRLSRSGALSFRHYRQREGTGRRDGKLEMAHRVRGVQRIVVAKHQ